MSDTLLLNADMNPVSILPLSVIGWEHAVKLMFLGRITVIETYPNWLLHSEKLTINVPSVAMTKEYFNYKKQVRFSRHNLYLRDLYRCQYCGEVCDHQELTIDHVVPRARGGKTSWTNCVASCKPCNGAKGDKIMKPLRAPFQPDYYNLVGAWKQRGIIVRNPGWYKYLGIEQAA